MQHRRRARPGNRVGKRRGREGPVAGASRSSRRGMAPSGRAGGRDGWGVGRCRPRAGTPCAGYGTRRFARIAPHAAARAPSPVSPASELSGRVPGPCEPAFRLQTVLVWPDETPGGLDSSTPDRTLRWSGRALAHPSQEFAMKISFASLAIAVSLPLSALAWDWPGTDSAVPPEDHQSASVRFPAPDGLVLITANPAPICTRLACKAGFDALIGPPGSPGSSRSDWRATIGCDGQEAGGIIRHERMASS
jgi:hypothetical protein